MNRTRRWKAAGEVLESDKCQETLITGKVRCQGIYWSPSQGDAQTDKLLGSACTPCTVHEEGATSINLCLLNILRTCSGALGVTKGVRVVAGPRGPGLSKEARHRTQGTLSHSSFAGVGTLQSAVECTLLVSGWVPLGTGLTGHEDRWGHSVP